MAADTYDVAVIGGGIYGACVLRDATLRGLKAVLLERADFGSGTSHNSNKIIHSGIRYLQHLDVPRVLECIQETSNWIRIAPHLVKPLAFVVPSYGFNAQTKEVMATGVKLHDLMKRLSRCGLPAGGMLSRAETLDWFPMLEGGGLRGSAYWYDGQLQNANQLVYECLADAISQGAEAHNYSPVQQLNLRAGEVVGVSARRSGAALEEVHARIVVNAAGPWLGDLLPKGLSSDRLDRHYLGMNLVIDQVTDVAALGLKGVSQAGDAKRSRLYFLTPWKGMSIVGTSHEFRRGSPDSIEYDDDLVDNFVQAANDAFPFLTLDRHKVRYIYQGLTPAAGDDERLTRSRQFSIIDHERRDNIRGLISVMGVKLTSARFIAERTVDLVERKLGRRVSSCATAYRLLPGAKGEVVCADPSASLMRERRALRAGPTEKSVQSLTDFIICRTELAERGALTLDDLNACADQMTSLRGWLPDKREAEVNAARARLRI